MFGASYIELAFLIILLVNQFLSSVLTMPKDIDSSDDQMPLAVKVIVDTGLIRRLNISPSSVVDSGSVLVVLLKQKTINDHCFVHERPNHEKIGPVSQFNRASTQDS